jgi:hypothetical protein
MRAIYVLVLTLFLALIVTLSQAQVANWWGGSASGTGYPTNSTPVTASTPGTVGAIAATLPGVAGKTTFICGLSMTSGGNTAAVTGLGTVVGTISGTLDFAYVAPAAGTQGRLVVTFAPVCIPASAMNTSIVVTQPAAGAGTVNAAVSAWGYQL